MSEDSDKKVPIDYYTSDLIKLLQAEYPIIVERVRSVILAATTTIYVTPCYEEGMIAQSILASLDYGDCIPQYGGKFLCDANTGGEFDTIVTGWCPHGAVAIEMGDPWDLDDWYYLGKGHSLQARITAGSSVLASTNIQAILQQLKMYGG